MNEKKITRKLEMTWKQLSTQGSTYYNYGTGIEMFFTYCSRLYIDLKAVEKYYKKEFNEKSTTKITDYEVLLLKLVKEVRRNVVRKDKMAVINSSFMSFSKNNFVFNNKELDKDKFIYEFDRNIGFKKETYEKVLPIANKIFMLEKMCSFITREFWKDEVTNINELDLKKPYKLIVRAIVKDGWRSEIYTYDIQDYFNKRMYFSTSFIDSKNPQKLFSFSKSNIMACLIMDGEPNKLVNASIFDCFTEEEIDGKSPFHLKQVYTDVDCIAEEKINNRVHKVFNEGTEVVTPKELLNAKNEYNEVVVLNPKCVGVIAPNRISNDYAREVADFMGVKYMGVSEPLSK